MISSRFVLSLFLISLLALTCVHQTSAVPLKRDRVVRLLMQKFGSMIQKKSHAKGNFLTDFFASLGFGNGNGNILNSNGNVLNGNGNAINGNGNVLNNNGNAINSNGNALNHDGNVINNGNSGLKVMPDTSGEGNPLHITRGPGGLSFELLGVSAIANDQVKDYVYGIPIDVSLLQRTNYPQFAFHFNDDVVPVNFNLNPSVHPQLSIELWVKMDNAINNRGWIIGHDNGGFDRSVILTDDRYSGIAFGTGTSYTSTLGLMERNKWTHIVGTFQSGRVMTMYRDFYRQQMIPVDNNEGETTMTIGGLKNFPGHTVDAWIGELRIYDVILTSQQVQSLYENRKTTYTR